VRYFFKTRSNTLWQNRISQDYQTSGGEVDCLV